MNLINSSPFSRKKWKRRSQGLWKNKYLLLMLVPATLYVIIFSYIPMTGLVLAFKDYNYFQGIYGSPWVGFSNFKFLLISNKLWSLTRNTILFNLVFITVGLLLQVGFAIILNELKNKYFKKIFQSFMFLPYFISWVVVAAIVQALFSYEFGLLNTILDMFGISRLNLYASAGPWPALLVAFKAWKQTGYGTIVYLAAITSIDPVLYEAAVIDGADVWKKIRYITLPSLVPIMIILVLLAIGQIFRGDFGLFYQLIGNNAQLLETTDILDLFIYRALSTTSDIGMASAAGFYQSILCFVTIMTANFTIKKIQADYSLF